MQIRLGSAHDMPQILDMLRAYRSQTPLEFLEQADDAEYITQMLTEFFAGKGIVLLAQDMQGVRGMLIAGIAPSIWSPKHLIMKEFAFWVNEDARGSSAGARLLHIYRAYGNQLKTEGRIVNFTISKMANSPDLKYGRYGFEKLEEFWVM
jgi:hypothetical protein